MRDKKQKNIFLKIIGSGAVLTIMGAILMLICVMMLLDFFGAKLTKDKIQNNAEYATNYIKVVNKYIKDGYVPLQRLLYFYLENTSLSFDYLYDVNLNKEQKITRDIQIVCEDQKLVNMIACNETNIKDNEEYLVVSDGRFNLPLDIDFTITSFFNEQRVIYGENNVHSGWDLLAPSKTPVYSVCNGVIDKVVFTQDENVPYSQSGNSTGNQITIKCDEDYNEIYYVVLEHLYPNSAKVKVGDKVNHWTEIAEVGTTGYSTGNHLHFQVENVSREKIDGMLLIDFNLQRFNYHYNFDNSQNNLFDYKN